MVMVYKDVWHPLAHLREVSKNYLTRYRNRREELRRAGDILNPMRTLSSAERQQYNNEPTLNLIIIQKSSSGIKLRFQPVMTRRLAEAKVTVEEDEYFKEAVSLLPGGLTAFRITFAPDPYGVEKRHFVITLMHREYANNVIAEAKRDTGNITLMRRPNVVNQLMA